MKASEISAEIGRETERRDAVVNAARKASLEVGALNGPDNDFCELTYIVGAIREADQSFETRT
ncbi:hypothetical protein G6L37_04325 [Agrobacterium rubi]|nr:hypothetical protein [Agrobacterium rubi]NTF24578.1 hypothetical protein [Agrobacterium rubi]